MSDRVTIVATLYRVAVDKEGAARITYDTPLSELAGVMRVLTQLNKRFKLTIEEDDSGS